MDGEVGSSASASSTSSSREDSASVKKDLRATLSKQPNRSERAPPTAAVATKTASPVSSKAKDDMGTSAFHALSSKTSMKMRMELSRKRRALLKKELGSQVGDAMQTELWKKSTITQDAAKKAVVRTVKQEGDAEQEEVYQDSKLFLKGLDSKNPHNDYMQHFVNTGQRPQNFIADAGVADRFDGNPDRQRLKKLKSELFQIRATPPMYIKTGLKIFDLADLGSKFDVIYFDPPLQEYEDRAPGVQLKTPRWSWDEIMNLKLDSVAANQSYLFMWVGCGTGLQKGRECMKRWGFKRCEDICWIKTNRNNPGTARATYDGAAMQHTKEHCLMGMRGQARRSTDTHFIHCNIDVDLIFGEEPDAYGSVEKPDEIFDVMETFCLGRRRLHLFASDSTIRPGWVSVGPEITSTHFDKESYAAFFQGPAPAKIKGLPSGIEGKPNIYVGAWPEIEQLRPKSPPGRGRGRGRGARGRGRGRDR